jgi:hypothetical protein
VKPDRPRRHAATAFVGGTILTMDTPGAAADAVVEGDRIVAVGDRASVAGFPDATIVDLDGRTLVPGFIDAPYLSIAAYRGSASTRYAHKGITDRRANNRTEDLGPQPRLPTTSVHAISLAAPS